MVRGTSQTSKETSFVDSGAFILGGTVSSPLCLGLNLISSVLGNKSIHKPPVLADLRKTPTSIRVFDT